MLAIILRAFLLYTVFVIVRGLYRTYKQFKKIQQSVKTEGGFSSSGGEKETSSAYGDSVETQCRVVKEEDIT